MNIGTHANLNPTNDTGPQPATMSTPQRAAPFTPFHSSRLAGLKRAYTTRQVPDLLVRGVTTDGTPTSGDVVIARVVQLGQHAKLESPAGRRQSMFAGDEILVSYANRYAPAQYEATVPHQIGPCDLVAAGGVAADALDWHASRSAPTRIDVLGFAADEFGRRINLGDHRLQPIEAQSARPHTIVVAGTSMDSGKTTTAASIIKGFVQAGYSVGAAKVTGTGAGGDVWLMSDSGASPVFDFTSAGMASTYLMGADRIIDSFVTLTDHLAASGVDIAVVEVADGLYQAETCALLRTAELQRRADRLVFAAGDAAGAVSGVAKLRSVGLDPHAVSGLLTASPLATREARDELDVPVFDETELRSADHCLGPKPIAARRPLLVAAAS